MVPNRTLPVSVELEVWDERIYEQIGEIAIGL